MNIPAPKGLAYKPFQILGIRYAMGARGTLIADEMGLGKTVQGIGVINASASFAKNRPLVLIVCPAFLKLNWNVELATWLTEDARASFVIRVISYNKADSLDVAGRIGVLILDEVHYAKNPESQRAKAVIALAAKADRVIALTGTPMPSRPIELWPILQMVCPHRWDPPELQLGVISAEKKKSHPGQGVNFWNFAERYCDLKKVSKKVGRYYKEVLDYSGATNLDELNKRLRATCMVRRLKRDVLPELPPKLRRIIPIEIDKPVRDDDLLPNMTYENYEASIESLRADKVLFEEWSKRRHEQALCIVDPALRIIGDALDETAKILVFGHHTDVLQRLHECLSAEFLGRDYAVLVTGQTSMSERHEAVSRFQSDSDCRVFVGSLGAAGVGLTLTAATLVVFIEGSPVPSEMTQGEDRAHRIGQRDTVLVWWLVVNGSIGARIAKIVIRKQQVISVALGDEGLAEEGNV